MLLLTAVAVAGDKGVKEEARRGWARRAVT